MISIILPCFRPPSDWQNIISDGIAAFKKNTNKDIELIIVDDGNADKSLFNNMSGMKEVADAFKFITYNENRGKGYALRQGVEAAKGDIIIYTDIDLPYTLESMINILKQLENGHDLVIGIKDSNYYNHVPAARKAISKTLRYFIRLFLQIPITDTQCGLKGFNESSKQIFLNTTIDRYLFDMEFVRECYKTKPALRILPVPITLKENIVFRKMNKQILIQESLNFIKVLYRRPSKKA